MKWSKIRERQAFADQLAARDKANGKALPSQRLRGVSLKVDPAAMQITGTLPALNDPSYIKWRESCTRRRAAIDFSFSPERNW